MGRMRWKRATTRYGLVSRRRERQGNDLRVSRPPRTTASPNGTNANYGERLNFPYSGSHFGCCGFNQPSQNLVNFFRVDGEDFRCRCRIRQLERNNGEFHERQQRGG